MATIIQPASSGGASVIESFEVDIDAATFNAMFATPVEIIPAPGANKVIVPLRIYLQCLYGTTQLTGGGNLDFQWGNTPAAGGSDVTGTKTSSNFTTITADRVLSFSTDSAVNSETTAACVNQGIYLSCSSANWANGDSVWRASGVYWIFDLRTS